MRRVLPLGALAYVAHLRALEKVSADDVENIFKNHVLTDSELPERLDAEVSTIASTVNAKYID